MKQSVYFEILVEDMSGKILLDQIMKKYAKAQSVEVAYRIHGFKGIGKIPSNMTNLAPIKAHALLTDLPNYLKGMDVALRESPIPTAIFVILDNDAENCKQLKQQLLRMYYQLDLSVQVFFCLAIEEIEAWLLGDKEAVKLAYPHANWQAFRNYKTDSICGTWECLADVVYKGGSLRLKKEAVSYYMIGKEKCEWAFRIGQHMSIRRNRSISFCHFIQKLDMFCNDVHGEI